MNGKWSNLAGAGALAVFGSLALMAIILVEPGDESMPRLALFFGVIATVIPALLGMLRADQSATNTNGKLDARIHDAVVKAQGTRRSTDADVEPGA